MKRPLALIFSLFFSLPALHSQAVIPVETVHFTVSQGTHPVGRSDFSIQPSQGGYTVSSHGSLTLPNTKYSFSLNGRLGQDLSIVSEDLNGIVNASAVTFAVRPAGGNLAVNISANGKSYANRLSAPSRTIFLPDFDLTGYQALLGLIAVQRTSPVSALVPKQTGTISVATVAPQTDAQATLNGAVITVHHLSVTIGTVVSELYYSADNRVLEVDIPAQTFTLLRDNFQLKQPPPPPAETSPNQNTQQK